MRKRPSSRLLVLDTAERVLLFRFTHPWAGREFWATPGGALEESETFEQAAVRELREETGIDLTDPGPRVAQRQCVMQLSDGEEVIGDERYYVIRADRPAVRFDGWTPLEVEVMTAHRWWTIAELEATAETVWPEELPKLLRSLMGA